MKPEAYTSITQWGLGGMDTLNDPQDIADNALADALNIVYDRGYPKPRGGSRTVWTKPTGETNAPLNMFAARASDGTNYAIAAYAPNFYLRDEQNNQWIKINQAYTPSTTYISYPYGYANWNAGIGNDVLYACNGYEDFVKWPIALSYLATGAAATDTTLTVTNGKAFPNVPVAITLDPALVVTNNLAGVSTTTGLVTGSAVTFNSVAGISGVSVGVVYYLVVTSSTTVGFASTNANALSGVLITLTGTPTGANFTPPNPVMTIVVKSPNLSEIVLSYSSVIGNTINLNSPIGTAVGAGSAVACSISELSLTDGTNPVRGKIVTTWNSRLTTANGNGKENYMWQSRVASAEDFVGGQSDGTPDGPFEGFFADGYGAITGIDDLGEYLVLNKQELMLRFTFDLSGSADSLDSVKTEDTATIVSGISMGVAYPRARIKTNNTLYYPTVAEGIWSIYPGFSGQVTQVTPTLLSQQIQPTILALSFVNSVGVGFNQKLLWSCAAESRNDTVICYDLIRQRWSRFDNWNVTDWLIHNGQLYFLSNTDGSVKETFTTDNTDDNQAYITSCYSRRWNFGDVSKPKSMQSLFLQGFLSTQTKLYVDVMFNEGGSQATVTYEIDGNSLIYVTSILPNAMGTVMLGIPFLDGSSLNGENGLGFFRVYLNLPGRNFFYNLQIRVYTEDPAPNWGITGIGFEPYTEVKSPGSLSIEPMGVTLPS